MLFLKFSMRVCKTQIDKGLYFAFEHPDGAKSWAVPCVKRLRARADVYEATFDMCSFGLKAPGSNLPMKKRTRIMTNLPSLARSLQGKYCSCTTLHQVIQGHYTGAHYTRTPLAALAAIYPRDFCEVILDSVEEQMMNT